MRTLLKHFKIQLYRVGHCLKSLDLSTHSLILIFTAHKVCLWLISSTSICFGLITQIGFWSSCKVKNDNPHMNGNMAVDFSRTTEANKRFYHPSVRLNAKWDDLYDYKLFFHVFSQVFCGSSIALQSGLKASIWMQMLLTLHAWFNESLHVEISL